jgi:prevent-host-death family protein
MSVTPLREARFLSLESAAAERSPYPDGTRHRNVQESRETSVDAERSDVLPITEARDRLAELVNRAAYGKERLVLGRRGKAMVALVPVEDLEALEAMEDRIELEEARKALAEWEADPGSAIPLEELARQYDV